VGPGKQTPGSQPWFQEVTWNTQTSPENLGGPWAFPLEATLPSSLFKAKTESHLQELSPCGPSDVCERMLAVLDPSCVLLWNQGQSQVSSPPFLGFLFSCGHGIQNSSPPAPVPSFFLVPNPLALSPLLLSSQALVAFLFPTAWFMSAAI
jgi:hypothetical protein